MRFARRIVRRMKPKALSIVLPASAALRFKRWFRVQVGPTHRRVHFIERRMSSNGYPSR